MLAEFQALVPFEPDMLLLGGRVWLWKIHPTDRAWLVTRPEVDDYLS